MVLHSHLICMASAVPSSLISNLSWGDMDDFLKFMKNYETHSRIISQPRSKTWSQILETPMTMVSNKKSTLQICRMSKIALCTEFIYLLS